MVCLLTTVVVCLLVTAGYVTCVDDFDLFCPYPWTDRTVQTLKCIVPTNKLNSPSPCDTYIDTVDFRIITASSNARACTVTNIDTACNNNNTVADTCGCQSNNGTHITIVYNINAVRSLHENARWACQPQCFDSSGSLAIEARNTSACFQTRFEDPNNNVGQAPEKEGGIGGAALKRNEGLSSEEKGGIGGGAAVVAIGCGSGVIVFVIKKTKIYVYLFFPPDQLKNYEILQKEIEKMWGVGIGKITPKDKEKYKNADYVIDISKLSGDQKQKLTELKALIVRLGGQLNCDELQAIEDAAYEPAADYPSGQQKKSKSDKEIPLTTVGRSSPPSETSGDEKTHMIPAKTGRVLPVPPNQPEFTSIGIGNSASQRLEPLKTDRSKMPSVERNSGAFSRDLPSPRQQPLEPIPSGKKG